MPNPTTTGPACLPLMRPYLGYAEWAGAWSRAAEGWLAWQLALWQPLIDAQGAWLCQCGEQSGWPMLPGLVARGGEQLA